MGESLPALSQFRRVRWVTRKKRRDLTDGEILVKALRTKLSLSRLRQRGGQPLHSKKTRQNIFAVAPFTGFTIPRFLGISLNPKSGNRSSSHSFTPGVAPRYPVNSMYPAPSIGF